MKRKVFFLLLLVSLVLFSFEGYAQKRNKKQRWVPIVESRALLLSDSLPFETAVSDLFDEYCKSTLEEKLYVHTDKENCLIGDTIWFTAYLSSAVTNLPSDYSRFMYIDLVDRSDSVFFREKYSRPDSLFHFSGYIPMSEHLRQGEYFIRAYTYWQQNQSEEFIYKKRIRVVNPFDHKIKCDIRVERANEEGKRVLSVAFVNHLNERYENAKFHYYIPSPNGDNIPIYHNTGYNGRARIVVDDPFADKIWIKFSLETNWDFEGYEDIPGSKRDFDVQFFPEGGALISGTTQLIGFKSIGRDGGSVPVSGAIYNAEGKRITGIESNDLGMGSFTLVADSTISYIARLKDKSGNIKEFALPKAERGVALQISGDRNKISYNIATSQDCKDKLDECYVLMHSRGLLFYALPAKRFANIKLNIEPVPEGIIHIILCDTLGNSYSERLWYHHSNRNVKLDVGYDDSFSNDNTRREFPVGLRYTNKKLDTATISLSVVNLGQGVVDLNSGGIEAYHLLTSDLGGHIENPGYYFNQSNSKRIQDLDALLLTQGWRRFNTEKLLNNEIVVSNEHYMERGPFISGRVKRLLSKKDLPSTVILTGGNGQAAKKETDEHGYFIFDDLWFEKGTYFIVQASNDNVSWNLEVLLDAVKFKKYTLNSTSYSMMSGDKDFYKRYSKDYIFGDNGERLSTLGTVSVKSYLRLTQEQIATRMQEDFLREGFMRGHMSIAQIGAAHMRGSLNSSYLGVDLLPIYSDFSVAWAINPDLGKGFNPYLKRLMDGTPLGIRTTIESWQEERENLKENDPKHSFDIQNADAFKILGYKVNIFNPEVNGSIIIGDIANRAINSGINIGAVVDNLVTPYKEYSWDKQIIMPFAPQKPQAFYKPKYENLTELQKEKIDEIITRYWCPGLTLKPDDRFVFKFPTAAGGENFNYMLIIEGITNKGEPIYITKKLLF